MNKMITTKMTFKTDDEEEVGHGDDATKPNAAFNVADTVTV